MSKAETGNIVAVNTIITRIAPSLECGLFAALLWVRAIREALNISANVQWRFWSTAQMTRMGRSPEAIAALRAARIIHFDVGKGIFDQHGTDENREFSRVSSLDLVLAQCDFTKRRPWLRDIVALVRKNDLDGQAVSSAPDNLRVLATGLISAFPDDSGLVLDFMAIGFVGMFARCKAGVPAADAFGLAEMAQGVAEACPKKSDWFMKMADWAVDQNQKDEAEAKEIVARAVQEKQFRWVQVPGLPRQVKVMWAEGRSPKIGPISRSKLGGADVCIIARPNGQVQIFGRNLFIGQGDQRRVYRIDLAGVARLLRIKEARAEGKRLGNNPEDWDQPGYVYFEDGTACPWYLAEFRTMVANGTQSSPDVPPTKMAMDEIFRFTCLALGECSLLIQDDQGEFQPCDQPAA